MQYIMIEDIHKQICIRNNSLVCIDLYLILPNSHLIDLEINKRSHVV